ncbi:MAG: single-stranded-DNA-specific exonuclease RecJ [Deltaproteobacteria bacterium]|nr:single-stranded-DNA-specific exonuclease RecJ [Deltaproteobacteria bacterium]
MKRGTLEGEAAIVQWPRSNFLHHPQGSVSPMSPQPQWIVHPAPPAETTVTLINQTGIEPLVAEILVRRGVADAASARRFLEPELRHLHDPFELVGMAAAVDRIIRALQASETILVAGDYDVDGLTSTALLTQFLQQAGAQVSYFIPNRFEHGYGLTESSLAVLLQRRPHLVITVDNGITAREEVAQLHRAGVDTIITDHHLPREEGVPEGIVVNPRQPGCTYPCKVISGCGVTFKLVMALRKRLREEGWWTARRPEPNLKDGLDLVAIGTVADVVPLLEENRVLVRFGLEVLNRSQRRPGIAALLAVCQRAGAKEGEITARTIGFQLAPRLNAAGRMTEGSLGVELLLSQDPARAAELAQRLDEENDTRRAVGEAMYREAVSVLEAGGRQEAGGLVVVSPQFHEGVIGIVASRLVERYHRPVVVLAENGESLKGSARSVPGVNVTQAIAACADLLEQWGGHAGAGGCRLPKSNLPAFQERFENACAGQRREAAAPAVYLEGRVSAAMLSPQLVEQVERLGPFGEANEEPLFLLEPRHLTGAPKILAEKHLKWSLGAQAEVVAWNKAQGFDPSLVRGFRVRLSRNEFRGISRVQLIVQDMLLEQGE